MESTITVPDEAKVALEQRARERGCSDVTTYIERLITTDLLAAKSFDEIPAPIRKAFQTSGMSEDEVEALFADTREEVYQECKAKERRAKRIRVRELSSIAWCICKRPSTNLDQPRQAHRRP